MGIFGDMLRKMVIKLLRDYQQEVYEKTKQALKKGYKSPLIVLPCRSRQELHNERNSRIG